MKVFVALLIAAFVAGTFGAVLPTKQNVRIASVAFANVGTETTARYGNGESSTSTTTPLRGYKGDTYTFTFTDTDSAVSRIVDNDRFNWVSGKTDCSSLADTDGAAITAHKGSQKFDAAGSFKLCYKQGSKPWQYYGNLQNLQIAEITAFDDGLGWFTGTTRDAAVTSTSLKDGDFVSWSLNSCTTGNQVVTTTTAANGNTVNTQGNVLASGKVTYSIAVYGDVNFRKYNICFKLTSHQRSGTFADPNLYVWAEDVKTDRALSFVFPRFTSADAMDTTTSTFKDGQTWRIGGRRLRQNDEITFTINAATNSKGCKIDAKPGTASTWATPADVDTNPIFVVGATEKRYGLYTGKTAAVTLAAGERILTTTPTVASKMTKIKVCYLPVGSFGAGIAGRTTNNDYGAQTGPMIVRGGAVNSAALTKTNEVAGFPTGLDTTEGLALIVKAQCDYAAAHTNYFNPNTAEVANIGLISTQFTGRAVRVLQEGNNYLFAWGCIGNDKGAADFNVGKSAYIPGAAGQFTFDREFWPEINFNVNTADCIDATKVGGATGTITWRLTTTTLITLGAGEGCIPALNAFSTVPNKAFNDGNTGFTHFWISNLAYGTGPTNLGNTATNFVGVNFWLVTSAATTNEDCWEYPIQWTADGTLSYAAAQDSTLWASRQHVHGLTSTNGIYVPFSHGGGVSVVPGGSTAADGSTTANIQIATSVAAGDYKFCVGSFTSGTPKLTANVFTVVDTLYTFPQKVVLKTGTADGTYAAGLELKGGSATLQYQYSETACISDAAGVSTDTTALQTGTALFTCTGCGKNNIVSSTNLASRKATTGAFDSLKSATAQKLCIGHADKYNSGVAPQNAALTTVTDTSTVPPALTVQGFYKGVATRVLMTDGPQKGDTIVYANAANCVAGAAAAIQTVGTVDYHVVANRQASYNVTFSAQTADATSKICHKYVGAGATAFATTAIGTYRVAEVTKITSTPATGKTALAERRSFYIANADFDLEFEGKSLVATNAAAHNAVDAIYFGSANAAEQASYLASTTAPANADTVGRILATTADAAAINLAAQTTAPLKVITNAGKKASGAGATYTTFAGEVELYVQIAKDENPNTPVLGGGFRPTGLKWKAISIGAIFPKEVLKGVETNLYFSTGFQGLSSSATGHYRETQADCALVGATVAADITAKKAVALTIGGTSETAKASPTLTANKNSPYTGTGSVNSDSALTSSINIPTESTANWMICLTTGAAPATYNKDAYAAGAALITNKGAAPAAGDAACGACTAPKIHATQDKYYVRAANKTTFSLLTGSDDYTVATGNAFRATVSTVACALDSATTADSTVTTGAISVTAYRKATWDITASAATDDTSKPHNLCYQFKSGGWKKVGTIIASDSGNTIIPTYMLAQKTAKETFTLTGKGFTTDDGWCHVLSTAACPTSCASALTVVGNTPTQATFEIAGTVSEGLAGTERKICYKAGGASSIAPSLTHDTGATIKFVSFKVYPNNAWKSAGTNRAVYVCDAKLFDSGDQVGFTDGTCSATTTLGTANGTYDLANAATYKTCYKRAADTRANAPVYENSRTTGNTAYEIIVNDDKKASILTANAAEYILVSDIEDTIALSGAINVVAGDSLRILATGKACDSHVAADAVATSAFVGTCSIKTTWNLKPSADTHPLCIKIVSGITDLATTNTEKYIALKTAATVKIATVTGFTPTTLLGNTWEKVTFSGNNLKEDDFASFVATYYNDCTKAWVYEQALSGLTAYFKLPAGMYTLCYLHRNAGAQSTGRPGYKYHSKSLLHPATVKAISKVMPMYTSGGKKTKVSLMISNPSTTPAGQSATALTGKDQIAFTTAACSATTNTAINITVDTSKTPTAYSVDTTLAAGTDGAAVTYKVCVNFEESLNYNPTTGTGFADSHDTLLTVKAFGRPTVAGLTPSKVVKNVTATLNFWGGYLGKEGANADMYHLLANDTCTNATITAIGVAVDSPTDAATSLHYTQSKDKKWTTTGKYNLCYKYAITQPFQADAGKNPASSTDTGLHLNIVNVDSISPTNAEQAATPTATDASGTITITFKGFFGANAADWAAFVPKGEDDCEKVTAWYEGRRKVTAVSETEGTAVFNLTDDAKGGEHVLCYKFSGVDSWTFYAQHVFSSRIINSISPTSALSLGQGTTQITIIGSGQRAGDQVFFIFANTTDKTNADCAAALAATPTTALDKQNVTASGKALVVKPQLKGTDSVTSYKICYKYGGQTTYDYEAVTLVVESAKINDYYVTGATDRVVKNPGRPTNFTFEGTGVTTADTARFINKDNSTDVKNCALGVAGVPGTSEYKITSYKNNWSINVGADEFDANSMYTLCYKFSSGEYQVIKMSAAKKELAVDVKTPKVVDGNYPKRFAAAGTPLVNIVGSGISAGDEAAWVQKAADCKTGITTAKVTPNADGKGMHATIETAAKDGKNWLCYKWAGSTDYVVAGAAIYVGTCNATKCADGQFFCPTSCECLAAGSEAACADPAESCTGGLVYCAGTGSCRRSITQCPPAGKCEGARPFTCPGKECAKSELECVIPAPCPVRTHIRCQDGSCARITDGCTFRGAPIVSPCAEGEKHCDLGNCVPATGKCTAYNGCPKDTPFQCSNCRCSAKADDCTNAANGGVSAGVFSCRDGSTKTDPRECSCAGLARARPGGAYIKKTAQVRRFVVRANAAVALNIIDASSPAKLATLDIPKNSLSASCSVQYMGVPNSHVYNFEGNSATSQIFSAPTGVKVVDISGADCALSAPASLTFLKTSIPKDTATDKVECKDLSGSTTATPKHTATPLTYKCEFEKAGAFALGAGTAVNDPNAQPNNTATATSTGTGTGTPTGGSPTVSSASTVSFSMAVAVVVAFVAALVF